MEIRTTTIHQVLLLKFDEMPRSRLLQRTSLSKLATMFEFGEVQALDNQTIVAQTGVLHDDSGDHPILQLVLEERRILLRVDGTSKDADAVYSKLGDFMAGLASHTNASFLQPILKSQDSEIVATLEFSADKLLAPSLVSFVESRVTDATNSEIAATVVKPGLVTFQIQYRTKDRQLDDYHISLSRKEFVVGPRPGFPLSERVYYSRAPVDTETHIGLLRQLEDILK